MHRYAFNDALCEQAFAAHPSGERRALFVMALVLLFSRHAKPRYEALSLRHWRAYRSKCG
jgi:hypothetical protein